MATSINRRVALLEQRQPRAPVPCVFDSEQTARSAGVAGGWLCIAKTMSMDEWAAAVLQQAQLTRGTHEQNA